MERSIEMDIARWLLEGEMMEKVPTMTKRQASKEQQADHE